MTGKLRVAFEKLGDRPFPDDSSDDNASQLHAELAEFDGYVAGRITTLINGGRLGRKELESDTALRSRLEVLASSDSPGSADAKAYLEYFRPTSLPRVPAKRRLVQKVHVLDHQVALIRGQKKLRAFRRGKPHLVLRGERGRVLGTAAESTR